MKLCVAFLTGCLLLSCAFAQAAPGSVTVPVTVDHERIIVDVRLPLADGSTKRVRAWVDNGNPDLWITEGLARKLGLSLTGEAHTAMGTQVRSAAPPPEIRIGTFVIHVSGIKEATAILDRESIASGSSAEINLPSTILRNYDVVVDYPNREMTIGTPGSVHFTGASGKALLNGQNGLVQIASTIEGQSNNLALDLGSCFSFLASERVEELRKAYAKWPHMTGAVGPANMWGTEDEANWEVLRIPLLQYGPVTLRQVAVASFPQEFLQWFQQRAGVPTAGLIGGNALLNYRVGIDYAHSTVYLDQVSKFSAPDMDVVGLVLRPQPDENYAVIGVGKVDGKPSVPDVQPGDVLVSIDKVPAKGGTMGQVWSLLGGSPGEARTLVLERAGKQFTVRATVRRFLEPSPGKLKEKKETKKLR